MTDKDRADRLAVRCESQRLKIEEQAERIKALEGALREIADSDAMYAVNPNVVVDWVKDKARALLGEK